MEKLNQENLDELDELKAKDIGEYYRQMEKIGEKTIDEHYKTPPEEKVVKIVKKKEDKEEVNTVPDYSEWLRLH